MSRIAINNKKELNHAPMIFTRFSYNKEGKPDNAFCNIYGKQIVEDEQLITYLEILRKLFPSPEWELEIIN